MEWLKIKYFKSYLILFFLIFCVIYGISLVAADSSASKIYVSLDGNDSWDGLSATYNGTSGPKLTIKNATNTVSSGGMVIIADGTYSGTSNSNITIDKNMIIKGSSRSGTILNGLDSYNIFKINSGCTVTVQDLTVTNGKAAIGGGILNLGHLTIDNCKFSNCKTIYVYLGGGSAICGGDDSTLSVKNSFFTGNDAILSTNGGGTICSNGTISIENSDFIGNTAYSGAIIYMFSGNANIESCRFINNTAVNYGGAITLYNTDSTINIHHSAFINNTANIVKGSYNIYNPINNNLYIQDNWWGSNEGPNGILGQINNGSSWILMNSSIDNDSIIYGNNITAEVSFNYIYHNDTQTVTQEDVGSILDGYDVTFSSNIGSFNPVSIKIHNGTAKSIFNPNTTGIGDLNFQFGNETITHTVTVEKIASKVVVNNTTTVGESSNLTAYLKDMYDNPMANKVVSFMINGTIIGNTTTDANGMAIFTYYPLNIGEYILTAIFNGDNFYNSTNSSSNLTVQPQSTVTVLNNSSGIINQDTYLLAYLKNVDGKPVANKTISFSVNGTPVGNATTDSSGLANLTFKPTKTGNFIIKAVFVGDTFNLASNNSATLSVSNPLNPVISVSKKSSIYSAPITVVLSMNKKGTIYFTNDGSNPTIKSKKYTSPIKISKNTNLRFFGIDTDNKKTNISTVKYVIAPSVIVSNPKNNAINVSRSKNFVFTFKFSENILKSINWNKIYIKNLKTGKMVSISKWVKENKLYLKMVKNRYPKTGYSIYIPAGSLKDKYGNMVKTYSFKFKTI